MKVEYRLQLSAGATPEGHLLLVSLVYLSKVSNVERMVFRFLCRKRSPTWMWGPHLNVFSTERSPCQLVYGWWGPSTWIRPCTWMLVTSGSEEHIWMFLVPKGHHGTGMIEGWPKVTSVNTSWYYMFIFHYFRNNQLPHSNYIGIGLKKWTTQCSIPHSPGLVYNTVLFICCGINAGVRRSSLLY